MPVHVTVEGEGAVLVAEVDRPEALNAVDFAVMEALEQLITRAETDDAIRAVILTGRGDRAFISGGDLRKFAALETEEDAARMATRMVAILARLEALPCWTIAAVNGDAYGGGCETLLAFDLVIAAEHARLGFTQTRFHVPPGWGGLTRLVHRVGKARALAWLGGERRVDTTEALRTGLIDQVCPPHALRDEALATAAHLARQDRAMIATLKQGAARALAMPRDEAIAAELAPFCAHWAGDEHHRRVRAFLDRAR